MMVFRAVVTAGEEDEELALRMRDTRKDPTGSTIQHRMINERGRIRMRVGSNRFSHRSLSCCDHHVVPTHQTTMAKTNGSKKQKIFVWLRRHQEDRAPYCAIPFSP
eukprot:scaffold1551_cov166-Amphora_coffeaeformis.AAC.4